MKYIELFRWSTSLLCILTCKGSFHYPKFISGASSPQQPSVSNPLYTEWSQWASCSATCGSGISSRTRYCLKSLKNDKGISQPLCKGEFSEHKMCYLKTCPENSADVKELQCSEYNNKVTAGRLIKSWVPSNGGPNPCELRCEATDETLVYSFGKVADGTSCPRGTCLNGRCLRVGCDGHVGSAINADMCGVCGGRNSTCVHYKDLYQGQLPSSGDNRGTYQEVVSIPYAARNLFIRQSLGKNILALQDRSKGLIFSENQNKYGERFDIAGTTFQFKKVSDSAEELLAEGPLTQELNVLVLLRAYNPGIFYEYWLPKHSQTPGRNPFFPVWYPAITTAPPKSFTTPPSKPFIHHHPPKPPFAYGYGEKPSKVLDLPVFRQVQTTPSSKRDYWHSTMDSLKFKNSMNYKSVPKLDYYQTFRNFSRQKIVDDSVSFTDHTQGDSGDVNGGKFKNKGFEDAYEDKKLNLMNVNGGKFGNKGFGDAYKDKKRNLVNMNEGKFRNDGFEDGYKDKKSDLLGSKKSQQTRIVVQKREDSPYRHYIPNERLKYSIDKKNGDKVHANSSEKLPPISINVLPDSRRETLKKKGHCDPCQRTRDQAKHFCDSDFVIRATVIRYEFVNGETRYEMDVKQSFKNTLSLLSKEYVWSPDTCRCPRLRPGKEYVIMGHSDIQYKKRESRLLVDKTSFVRTFNLKYARRLQKLRKDQLKNCKKIS